MVHQDHSASIREPPKKLEDSVERYLGGRGRKGKPAVSRLDPTWGREIEPNERRTVLLGEFDPAKNPYDLLIAEEHDKYKLACRLGVGVLPDDLEERLGTERYQAWLAISVVERKVFCDRMTENWNDAVAHKYDLMGVIVFGMEERVRMGL